MISFTGPRARLAISIAFIAVVFAVPAFITKSPTPDWPSFYAGAKLWVHGSSRLYSFVAVHGVTSRFIDPSSIWAFVRLPAYATALTPLGWFEPRTAFFLWQFMNLGAALAAVALLFRTPLDLVAVLSCAPLWVSFKQGQDMPLLLLELAVCIALLQRKHPFAAGLVFALCGIKFHLLLLIPVFFLVRRQWSMAAGAMSGALTIIGVCFAIFGRSWPAEYYACIIENQKHLKTESFLFAIHSHWWMVLVCMVAIFSCAAMCRKAKDDSIAFQAALAMSLLVAPRLYIYDLVIALPAFLLAFRCFLDEADGHGGTDPLPGRLLSTQCDRWIESAGATARNRYCGKRR